MSDKCPGCGAEICSQRPLGQTRFACGSIRDVLGELDMSEWCADACRAQRDKLRAEVERLKAANADIQASLDSTATKLVAAVNSRNSIGVQLDLVRDELLRIQARIREEGLEDKLSAILLYCDRAQKDIAVGYTPIDERDANARKITALLIEVDLLKAKVEKAYRAGWDDAACRCGRSQDWEDQVNHDWNNYQQRNMK